MNFYEVAVTEPLKRPLQTLSGLSGMPRGVIAR